MVGNPWASRSQRVESDPRMADTPVSQTPDYAVPQHGSYAVPPLAAGDAYINEFGWGPGQRLHAPSSVETPSAQRLQTIPRYSFSPDPDQPPQNWYAYRDADDARRHTVEDQDADGRTELKGVSSGDRRWVDNPRRNPPAESRPTQTMSPSSYSFVRPFDTGYARTFNGMHFSMADHRRNYEILGMAPVSSRRNTYRLEPTPWDQNVVDVPENPEQSMPYARLKSPDLPVSRQWRLM